ncbi:hypothetical protein C8R45DRAFT_1015289 [Mycena sanguinolenta]|nr:hypothetical protein C8R45DRAFT_1015289 [Mycena sanguinolenta]
MQFRRRNHIPIAGKNVLFRGPRGEVFSPWIHCCVPGECGAVLLDRASGRRRSTGIEQTGSGYYDPHSVRSVICFVGTHWLTVTSAGCAAVHVPYSRVRNLHAQLLPLSTESRMTACAIPTMNASCAGSDATGLIERGCYKPALRALFGCC